MFGNCDAQVFDLEVQLPAFRPAEIGSQKLESNCVVAMDPNDGNLVWAKIRHFWGGIVWGLSSMLGFLHSVLEKAWVDNGSGPCPKVEV